MLSPQSEAAFTEYACNNGWNESAVTALIKLVGGFDHLIVSTNYVGTDVLRSVRAMLSLPDDALPQDINQFLILLQCDAIRAITTPHAELFYEHYNKQLAQSLWSSSTHHSYDRYWLMRRAAPDIPSSHLPVFFRGLSGESVNTSGLIPSVAANTAHYVVLYSLYLLMYELALYLEHLVNAQMDYNF